MLDVFDATLVAMPLYPMPLMGDFVTISGDELTAAMLARPGDAATEAMGPKSLPTVQAAIRSIFPIC